MAGPPVPLCPPPWRTSAEKRWGSLSRTTSPSRAAPRRAMRGRATRGSAPARGFTPDRTREIRANPCPMRVSGHNLDHRGEDFAPPRVERWGGLKGTRHHVRPPPCATPPFVGWATSYDGTGVTPRRRKSSDHSAAVGWPGFPAPIGRSFSMTGSRPAWRSTVSCPLIPRALAGGRLRSPGP